MSKSVSIEAVIDLLLDRWVTTRRTVRGAESVFRGRLVDINDAIQQLPEADVWTPVEEGLPETRDFILLSLENHSVPVIGRCGPGRDGIPTFYIGAYQEEMPGDLVVNAWAPLPAPYRRET